MKRFLVHAYGVHLIERTGRIGVAVRINELPGHVGVVIGTGNEVAIAAFSYGFTRRALCDRRNGYDRRRRRSDDRSGSRNGSGSCSRNSGDGCSHGDYRIAGRSEFTADKCLIAGRQRFGSGIAELEVFKIALNLFAVCKTISG